MTFQKVNVNGLLRRLYVLSLSSHWQKSAVDPNDCCTLHVATAGAGRSATEKIPSAATSARPGARPPACARIGRARTRADVPPRAELLGRSGLIFENMLGNAPTRTTVGTTRVVAVLLRGGAWCAAFCQVSDVARVKCSCFTTVCSFVDERHPDPPINKDPNNLAETLVRFNLEELQFF